MSTIFLLKQKQMWIHTKGLIYREIKKNFKFIAVAYEVMQIKPNEEIKRAEIVDMLYNMLLFAQLI